MQLDLGIKGCLMSTAAKMRSSVQCISQESFSSAVKAARETKACHSLKRSSHCWIWAAYCFFHFSRRINTGKSTQNSKLKIRYIRLILLCTINDCCSNAFNASEALYFWLDTGCWRCCKYLSERLMLSSCRAQAVRVLRSPSLGMALEISKRGRKTNPKKAIPIRINKLISETGSPAKRTPANTRMPPTRSEERRG